MDRIPSQIVSLEGEKYAILQENLTELVRIPAAEVKNKIDKVGNMPFVRLRQDFLPLLDLADVLGVQKNYLTANGESKADRRKQIADRRSVQHIEKAPSADLTVEKRFIDRQEKDRRTKSSSAVNIAIVNSKEYKYGLVVGRFNDSEEIEIRPAGRYLEECGIYLGATTFMNERASLVLDIFNIAHKANLSQLTDKISDTVTAAIQENTDSEHFSLLTFRNSKTEYFAADLDSVERIERFKSSDFEKIGKNQVIQYRGGALPLFELSKPLKCFPFTQSDHQEVIVFKHENRLFGLKVVPPVDTVERRLTLDKATFNTPPVTGSAIINNNTTLLLDIPAIAAMIREAG